MTALLRDSVAFHNVAELVEAPGGGCQLQRFPRALRERLGFKAHTRGRFWSERASGCEIRFVTEGAFVRVALSAREAGARVLVFKGDYAHGQFELPPGVVTTLFLEEPPFFAQVEPSALRQSRFAPSVWRLLFNQDALPVFHGVESFGAALRPPRAEELPRFTWLAHGSSITFGGNALHPTNTYVQHAARLLGVDVLNKGIPGGCLCEPEMAAWLAQLSGWDFATLELGVNLVDHATPDEFRDRAATLIAMVHCANPTKPIEVMNIFPNRCDALRDAESVAAQRTRAFNAIVPQLVADLASDRVGFIDGREILRDTTGLASDLLHPADDGHLAMGDALARRLAARLPFLSCP